MLIILMTILCGLMTGLLAVSCMICAIEAERLRILARKNADIMRRIYEGTTKRGLKP